MPLESINYDKEQSIQLAMQNRPDLKQATQSLDVDDLGIQTSRNALLPNLALTGNYTVNGRGGIFLQKTSVFNEGVPTSVLSSIPGGITDALGQMFGLSLIHISEPT